MLFAVKSMWQLPQDEERLHVYIHTWQLPGNNTFKTGMQIENDR